MIKFFKYRSPMGDFHKIRIRLASAKDILDNSNGSVENTEGLSFRTMKPVPGGLCCPRIFGPTSDYRCECRKYSGIQRAGIRCEECHVLVATSSLRRFNLGHINLEYPVLHPWFHGAASRLIHITKKDLSAITKFEKYIAVEDSKDGKITRGKIIDIQDHLYEFHSYPEFKTGAEAIRDLLLKVDLKKEIELLEEKLKKQEAKASYIDLNKIQNSIDFYQEMINADVKVENMILTVINVTPPESRPTVHLFDNGIISSRRNDLYKSIIKRRNRLLYINKLPVPDVIRHNEYYLISKAVYDLIGSSKDKSNSSFVHTLIGKRGFMRRGLLGSRQDFSARAVLTAGPNLPTDTCGIPVAIAMRLLRPFIAAELMEKKYVMTFMEAKHFVDNNNPVAVSILYDIIDDFLICINRAPTLHRLGIQGFKIRLVTGHAISFPVLVCAVFNADNDGDTVAAHLVMVPTLEDVAGLMLSTNNLFIPGSGIPAPQPAKDITLGLYYMTIVGDSRLDIVCISIPELFNLVEKNICNMNTLVNVYIQQNGLSKLYETTYGRITLWQGFPKIEFEKFNRVFTKNEVKNIIFEFFDPDDYTDIVSFLDYIKDLAFKNLTQSGITFSLDDVAPSPNRDRYIQGAMAKQKQLEESYSMGLMTHQELQTKTLELWRIARENLKEETMRLVSKRVVTGGDANNVTVTNLYAMIDSGARGSANQVHQLCGFKGFMSKANGSIGDIAIPSSFLTGSHPYHYFDTCDASRKGLYDTSSKVAHAGFLSRRLSILLKNIIITRVDCGTVYYITYNIHSDLLDKNIDLFDSIYGFVLAKDIIANDGSTLAEKNAIIDKVVYNIILDNVSNITYVSMFNPVFCLAEDLGLCVKCYGIDLAYHKKVCISAPVGIVAAQSVGEIGTQLMMRTFHQAGMAHYYLGDIETIFKNTKAGYILYSADTIVFNGTHYIALESTFVYIMSSGRTDAEVLEEIAVPYGLEMSYDDGAYIDVDYIIGIKNNTIKPIVSQSDGILTYVNVVDGINYQMNDTLGCYSILLDSMSVSYDIFAYICVTPDDGSKPVYFALENNTILTMDRVREGIKVKKGAVVGRVHLISKLLSTDIATGLDKIIKSIEVKKPKKEAFMANFDGYVTIDIGKTKKYFVVAINETKDTDSNVLQKINVPTNIFLYFNNGMKVQRGDKITEGEISIQDMLSLSGIENTVKFFTTDISSVYIEQGSHLNFKHIYVVLRRMLSKVIVVNPGDADVKKYSLQSRIKVLKKNLELAASKMVEITYKECIYSVTKVALELSDSWLLSACFQNTIQVLSSAALVSKVDPLVGIGERDAMGKMLNTGTGYFYNMLNGKAVPEDLDIYN